MRPYLGSMLSGACLVVLLGACSGGPGGENPAADDTGQDGRRPSPPATALHIPTSPAPTADVSPHPYVGMWVTADGHIRQMLLPNGRYDEARGERESAYTGSYRITGTRIEYDDDTGFSADGTFDGDILHHGGYLFYREGSDAHREARADGAIAPIRFEGDPTAIGGVRHHNEYCWVRQLESGKVVRCYTLLDMVAGGELIDRIELP